MALDNFYAVTETTAPLQESEFEVRDVNLTVHHLGTLPIPSKTVGAADPFVIDGSSSFAVPKDQAEVYVTVADVSDTQDGSHTREAYLSIIFSDATPVSVTSVNALGENELTAGQYYGVPVDAGTVSFFDAAAMHKVVDSLDEDKYEDMTDRWMDLMDETKIHPDGLALAAYPKKNSSDLIAISHSGWGDGWYPVMQTVDADGNMLGLHIDLQVVGVPEDETNLV